MLQEQIDNQIKRHGSDPEFYIRALITKERFIKRLCDEIDQLRVQLNKKDREIRLVKVARDREKFSRELYYSLYTFWSKEAAALKAQLQSQSSSTVTGSDTRGPTGWVLSSVHPPKPLSIQQLIEGHAESIRMSVEGFPDWVKELKVKEQLGFFEPILEGPEDCPQTS